MSMDGLNKMGVQELAAYLKESNQEITIEDGKITNVNKSSVS